MAASRVRFMMRLLVCALSTGSPQVNQPITAQIVPAGLRIEADSIKSIGATSPFCLRIWRRGVLHSGGMELPKDINETPRYRLFVGHACVYMEIDIIDTLLRVINVNRLGTMFKSPSQIAGIEDRVAFRNSGECGPTMPV